MSTDSAIFDLTKALVGELKVLNKTLSCIDESLGGIESRLSDIDTTLEDSRVEKKRRLEEDRE